MGGWAGRSGSSRRYRSGRSRTAFPAAVFPVPRGRNAGAHAAPPLLRWAGDEAERRARSVLPALARPSRGSQSRPRLEAERERAGQTLRRTPVAAPIGAQPPDTGFGTTRAWVISCVSI